MTDPRPVPPHMPGDVTSHLMPLSRHHTWCALRGQATAAALCTCGVSNAPTTSKCSVCGCVTGNTCAFCGANLPQAAPSDEPTDDIERASVSALSPAVSVPPAPEVAPAPLPTMGYIKALHRRMMPSVHDLASHPAPDSLVHSTAFWQAVERVHAAAARHPSQPVEVAPAVSEEDVEAAILDKIEEAINDKRHLPLERGGLRMAHIIVRQCFASRHPRASEPLAGIEVPDELKFDAAVVTALSPFLFSEEGSPLGQVKLGYLRDLSLASYKVGLRAPRASEGTTPDEGQVACWTCGFEQSTDGTEATCRRCLTARVASLKRMLELSAKELGDYDSGRKAAGLPVKSEPWELAEIAKNLAEDIRTHMHEHYPAFFHGGRGNIGMRFPSEHWRLVILALEQAAAAPSGSPESAEPFRWGAGFCVDCGYSHQLCCCEAFNDGGSRSAPGAE